MDRRRGNAAESPALSAWLSGPHPAEILNAFAALVHNQNRPKWWVSLRTGKPIRKNVGELLMLLVSEVAEAMEGHRKNLPDDKLPHRKMFEVELADALIRIFDISAGLKLDLGGAFVDKMRYNATRHDHSPAARLKKHGKKY